jgi:hypothetical protein
LLQARIRVPHESRATEPSSLARQIALAHFIEERIESGELASYAEAAETARAD